jgi:hypothetical protein
MGSLEPWSQGSLETTVLTGWTVYYLPDQASPYGIAYLQDYQWVADQGRQKLVRISVPEYRVFLPLVMSE